MGNTELYNNQEYGTWAMREGLILAEEYLFSKYVFKLDKRKKILDIGTGNGRFLFELAKKGFNDLHGIDLAENLLSVAQKKSSDYYPFINIYKMDASCLKFNGNTFDIILALQQIISF